MLIIAHRGCSYPGYNQNTIRSFKKVMDQGAPAVEFDVQVTQDQELVIVHNLDLTEVSTGTGVVSGSTKNYIRSLWAGKPEQGQDKIPLLQELIDLAASYPPERRAVLHLELKGPGSGLVTRDLLTQVLEAGTLRPQDFFISSFLWKELDPIRESFPQIPFALLAGAIDRLGFIQSNPQVEPWIPQIFAYPMELYMLPKDKTLDQLDQRFNQVGCPAEVQRPIAEICEQSWSGQFYTQELIDAAVSRGAYSLNLWHLSVQESFVHRAHQAGLKVFVYTVNDETEVRRLQAIGADGFFTDFYELFLGFAKKGVGLGKDENG
jgi:glycerophosphoryl diester phosphodiesterase